MKRGSLTTSFKKSLQKCVFTPHWHGDYYHRDSCGSWGIMGFPPPRPTLNLQSGKMVTYSASTFSLCHYSPVLKVWIRISFPLSVTLCAPSKVLLTTVHHVEIPWVMIPPCSSQLSCCLGFATWFYPHYHCTFLDIVWERGLHSHVSTMAAIF